MRIALIEYSPADQAWFTRVLKETGLLHELGVYSSGVEALEKLPTMQPPDVIVCDWFLPTLRFPEFVRKLSGLANVPIAVFVMSEQHEAMARQWGVDALLKKPMDVAQMYRLFRIGAARAKAATQV